MVEGSAPFLLEAERVCGRADPVGRRDPERRRRARPDDRTGPEVRRNPVDLADEPEPFGPDRAVAELEPGPAGLATGRDPRIEQGPVGLPDPGQHGRHLVPDQVRVEVGPEVRRDLLRDRVPRRLSRWSLELVPVPERAAVSGDQARDRDGVGHRNRRGSVSMSRSTTRSAASAASSAGRRAAGSVIRTPSAPQARAYAAKSGFTRSVPKFG